MPPPTDRKPSNRQAGLSIKPEIICPDVAVDKKNNIRYRRGNVLGKGGFAKVFEFIHLQTFNTYAGKVISKAILAKPKTKEKLLSEIRIHNSLHHPTIVQFNHCFEDKDNTLLDVVRKHKRLTEAQARFYMLQLVPAIIYLHDNNVIHRDLKLGNIFLGTKDEIKVGDFGLAAKLTHKRERRKTICGTPNYLAPEILTGGENGHSFEVDVWALGVILYTMVVGRPPFETANVKETYQRIKRCDYRIPKDYNISKECQELIQGILQVDVRNRMTLDEIQSSAWMRSADAYSQPTASYGGESKGATGSTPSRPASLARGQGTPQNRMQIRSQSASRVQRTGSDRSAPLPPHPQQRDSQGRYEANTSDYMNASGDDRRNRNQTPTSQRGVGIGFGFGSASSVMSANPIDRAFVTSHLSKTNDTNYVPLSQRGGGSEMGSEIEDGGEGRERDEGWRRKENSHDSKLNDSKRPSFVFDQTPSHPARSKKDEIGSNVLTSRSVRVVRFGNERRDERREGEREDNLPQNVSSSPQGPQSPQKQKSLSQERKGRALPPRSQKASDSQKPLQSGRQASWSGKRGKENEEQSQSSHELSYDLPNPAEPTLTGSHPLPPRTQNRGQPDSRNPLSSQRDRGYDSSHHSPTRQTPSRPHTQPPAAHISNSPSLPPILSHITVSSCDAIDLVSHLIKSTQQQLSKPRHISDCSLASFCLRFPTVPVLPFLLNQSSPSTLRRTPEALIPTLNSSFLKTSLPLPPAQSSSHRPPAIPSPIRIVSWVDYSNKYGLGYELSNGTIGVLYNDRTSMVGEKETPGQRSHCRYDYCIKDRRASESSAAGLVWSGVFASETASSVDECEWNNPNIKKDDVRKKVSVFKHIFKYITSSENDEDEEERDNDNELDRKSHLKVCRELAIQASQQRSTEKFVALKCPSSADAPKFPRSRVSTTFQAAKEVRDPTAQLPLVHVVKWIRTNLAMVFILSNGTVQANFTDHTKIIIVGSCECGYITRDEEERLRADEKRDDRSLLDELAQDVVCTFISQDQSEKTTFISCLVREEGERTKKRVNYVINTLVKMRGMEGKKEDEKKGKKDERERKDTSDWDVKNKPQDRPSENRREEREREEEGTHAHPPAPPTPTTSTRHLTPTRKTATPQTQARRTQNTPTRASSQSSVKRSTTPTQNASRQTGMVQSTPHNRNDHLRPSSPVPRSYSPSTKDKTKRKEWK
ncbi:putative Cell cycle serine/threonine-protein kinase CDC5/MSD2 [Blattamonas nauphoetae]|uniref:Serine/threonine-protein kinase PLK n=1 Tax=Blattamonas nauphoetae TaxID=2049346 RepID=A0ABQ9XM42_9EUKA|nr:putative Cell cycle serine/threonine-protein kinase CDC5/MSD2 [Blattamonas nauphoetae]